MINFEGSRILAFFAHPDDETLGAGGTLAKLCDDGVEVYIAIAATGGTSRDGMSDDESAAYVLELQDQCRVAAAILGVNSDRVLFGGFPDNRMDSQPLLSTIKWLENVIQDVQPSVIFTHHQFCTNVDHQYCFSAAVVATRPTEDLQIDVICCEVPSSTGHLRPANWEPNFYVEIKPEQLQRKIAAMVQYDGEMRRFPHPRSGEALEAYARVRGAESGFNLAESFMIYRTFKASNRHDDR